MMGASDWFVAVPYQEDISEALRVARRKVYASGDIHDIFGILHGPEAAIARLREQSEQMELPPGLPADEVREIRRSVQLQNESRIAEIERFAAVTDVEEKIEALRRAVGFEGTHTIIDIPSTEQLRRVEDEELVHRYGTELPSLATIEETSSELVMHVGRFEGVWLVAEDDQGNRWICFAGVSGD